MQRAATLILGGMHGDEPKSVHVAAMLLELLMQDRQAASRGWIIVPIVNPDGYAIRSRRNARGVDLNRNYPTADWQHASPRSRMYGGRTPASEPETRTLIRLIRRRQPARIISIHSISHGLYCNNYDGPARGLAQRMRRFNRYPVRSTIGYPTPGSLGTWAGAGLGLPVVTLELPSHHSPQRCWLENREALLAAISASL